MKFCGHGELAGAEQAAEKCRDSWENDGKRTSGAEARVDFVGFIAGDESPAYPISGFSASGEAPFILLALVARLKPCPFTKPPPTSFSASCGSRTFTPDLQMIE